MSFDANRAPERFYDFFGNTFELCFNQYHKVRMVKRKKTFYLALLEGEHNPLVFQLTTFIYNYLALNQCHPRHGFHCLHQFPQIH